MDTFEQYRQTMFSEAESDETIGEALANGILSQEAIEKAVNDFMATTEGFSEWYVKWQESMKGADVSVDISFSDQITKSQESLDKFQSSVKSASEAYATLLSGNYSSTELLDSIQAINEAVTVTDLKGSIDWEEIDSLDLLSDKLEEVSRVYAESILSGAGIEADEYYSYLEKHYDKQLTYMDKVVRAVTRRIDKEIDALEKQKDDVESIYQVQIDALEKQKTLLQEANKERLQQVDYRNPSTIWKGQRIKGLRLDIPKARE